MTIGGDPEVPQEVMVEVDGPIPDELESRLSSLAASTEWEFHNDDDVFRGDNESAFFAMARQVHPDDFPHESLALREEFNRSESL